MKIPKTTKDEPYIDFRFDKKGKMTLSITSAWWGGIRSGFYATGGIEGNTCLPKDLNKYITFFKKRKIKEIEREIAVLQKKLDQFKNVIDDKER